MYDVPNPEPIEVNEQNSTFLQLIRHLTKIEPETYNYILDWISKIIQHPERKTGWAIVLYSKAHGVGKNRLQNGICELIGENYTGKVEKIDDLDCDFNIHLSNKLIIYADEIDAKTADNMNLLKNIITREQMNSTRKGVDTDFIADFANYLFTTNNEYIFKFEGGDRRFVVIDCGEEILSKEFYELYSNDLKDVNKMRNLFQFFKTREIVHTDNRAPMTEIKLEATQKTRPAYIQHIYNAPDEYIDIAIPNNYRISSLEIHKMTINYAKSATPKLKQDYSCKATSKWFRELLGDAKKSNGIISRHIQSKKIPFGFF